MKADQTIGWTAKQPDFLFLISTHFISSKPPKLPIPRCTTNSLVQHSHFECCKATVTKQQFLGGGLSYRHGDPHSFGPGRSLIRRSRPSRTLPDEERRCQCNTTEHNTTQHSMKTTSVKTSFFTPFFLLQL